MSISVLGARKEGMMPNRHYVPSGGKWPVWVDHVMAHIYEMGLAAISIAVGVRFLIGGFVPSFIPSALLTEFLAVNELIIGAPMVLGGGTVLVATAFSFKTRVTYWLILRTGVLLSALGWAAYMMSLTFNDVGPAVSWWIAFGLTLTLITRFIRSFIDEHRIKGVFDQDRSWEVHL